MVKVKICGITNHEDARLSCELGADLLGFVFVSGTPRFVDPETVRDIVFELKGRHSDVGFTGLFMNEDLAAVAEKVVFTGIDLVQLHGEESPDYCAELKDRIEKLCSRKVRVLKVFKVGQQVMPLGPFGPTDYPEADYFVFDTHDTRKSGGTGLSFNWDVLAGSGRELNRPFFLAGGLGPGNVESAIRRTRPYGVDVSSGIESTPGKKNERSLREFIKNAKKTDISR